MRIEIQSCEKKKKLESKFQTRISSCQLSLALRRVHSSILQVCVVIDTHGFRAVYQVQGTLLCNNHSRSTTDFSRLGLNFLNNILRE